MAHGPALLRRGTALLALLALGRQGASALQEIRLVREGEVGGPAGPCFGMSLPGRSSHVPSLTPQEQDQIERNSQSSNEITNMQPWDMFLEF